MSSPLLLLPYTLLFITPSSSRYKGHSNADYKVDSCLTQDDAHVVSGSEDGRVCFWDLVEVSGQWVWLVGVVSASSSKLLIFNGCDPRLELSAKVDIVYSTHPLAGSSFV
jgi:WD40 repeat protein